MTSLPFGLLALPREAGRELAPILRKVRLSALRALLTFPADDLDPPEAAALRSLQALLPDMARKARDRVFDAVGAPDVLPPLLCIAGGIGDGSEHLRAAVPNLLAALVGTGKDLPPAFSVPDARQAENLMSEALLWSAPLTTLTQARGGWAARFRPPARALLADRSGLEVELSDGSRAPVPHGKGLRVGHALHFLDLPDAPLLHIAMIDTNPMAMVEDHPDKHGNAFDLGGHTLEQWSDAISAAIDLVGQALPTWRAELPLALTRLIPVGFDSERHLSASYREAPGLIYLSLHPDPLTMAEALVNEVQRGKLNALSWLDPVLVNGYSAWTDSPVRLDLRPLMGVLLAAHAFVPVAALHARLAELDHPLAQTGRFAERRAEVLDANARSLDAVERLGEPTPIGRQVMRALRALNDATLAPAGSAAPHLPTG